MFEIIYLSRKDRDRLTQIEQKIGSPTPEEVTERNEILSRRKRLHEMTVQECGAMKAEISAKIAKIAAVGRLELARSFVMMIGQLDQRIDTLLRYPQKAPQSESGSPNPLKARKSNPLSRPRRSKWTSRISVPVADHPKAGPKTGSGEGDR